MTSKLLPPGEAELSPSMPSVEERDTRVPAHVITSDILYGADEIAVFLFGDKKYRRRVYSRIASNELPIFRIGANICARRSTLLEWIARREGAPSK